ncbi:MAG: DNA polymerase III subunit delta [Rickettsiaceae bacterium]|nr:DNA polymerase III subunit delta [Rickettsiaceae bacterium]MDP5083160.1 DNA polymerase III subunit delta [Rickettsiaceae bacterium]
MKFYSSGLTDLIKKIEKGGIKTILIYGLNQGFATTAIQQIIAKLNLRVNHFDAKEITPTKLELIANSRNFFGQRELIKITNTGSGLNKAMKEALMHSDFYNIVCFVANDSLPATGIRKFFEEQNHCASLGCYYDNEQTIAKIILQQCTKYKKTIEEDALFYLKSHLRGDHQIIKSELEKLFNFTHDKSTITKHDILQTLSHDLLASGDEMCIFFTQKEPLKFLKEVAKLQAQSKNEVLMIRALIRYYLNIYTVTSKLEDGENLDRAIKTLYPPIFFKYIDEFKQVVRKHSSDDALRCIEILQKAEISYKTNPKCYDLFSTYLKCNN